MNKYKLNDEERQIWYNQTVRPLFLDGRKPADNPSFVLLTAQSAAGKTTASTRYANQLSTYPAKFSGDDIRSVHPHAQELLEINPVEYPFITKDDMAWARENLVEESLKNKFNIQIDAILASSEDWKMGTLLKAKDAGYNIECVALGVHRYLSEVSMFLRREEQIKTLNMGFPVTKDAHDKAYNVLPEVVARMYDEGVADKVSIYNRDFSKYYDTSEAENPNGRDIMKGIIKSREDYLTIDSLKLIDATWGSVLDTMSKRNASEEQLSEARLHYQAFRKDSGLYLFGMNPNFKRKGSQR